MTTSPPDFVIAVLAVRMGYVSATDVMTAASDSQADGRSLAEVLESRGLFDASHRQALEAQARRATAATNAGASEAISALNPIRYAPGPTRCPAGRYLPSNAPGRRRDAWVGREVAWETASGRSASAEQSFLEQLRMVACLDHPAVQPVLDVGRDQHGSLYATRQVISERTLDSAMKRARTMRERLALLPICLTVARCLAAAHAANVTHNALTPEMIVLGDFGEVYVTGWQPLLARGPEAVREDLRALGALLWQVVNGADREPSRLLPADLLAVVSRAHREAQHTASASPFTSVEQLANELGAWLDGSLVASHEYTLPQRWWRSIVKARRLVITALIGVSVLTAASLFSISRMRAERDQARLFAQSFLDDVGEHLRAVPGVEPVVERVTGVAIAHYERTTGIEHATAEERARVARALSRLADLLLALDRVDEGSRALDFASRLVARLEREDPTNGELVALEAELLFSRLLVYSARHETEHYEQGIRHVIELTDRARRLAPRSLRAWVIAMKVRTRYFERGDVAETNEVVDTVITLAQAQGAHPDALSVLSEALMAKAELSSTSRTPDERFTLMEQSVVAARGAVALDEVHPAYREALLARLSTMGQALHDDGSRSKRALLEARELAEARLREWPTDSVTRQQLVEVQLNLGSYAAAWQEYRALEARGQVGRLHGLGAAVACLAGAYEDALRLSNDVAVADEPSTRLYRSLAAALSGRPAVARAAAQPLTGQVHRAMWLKGAVEALVSAHPGPEPQLASTVSVFAHDFDAALGSAEREPLEGAFARYLEALQRAQP